MCSGDRQSEFFLAWCGTDVLELVRQGGELSSADRKFFLIMFMEKTFWILVVCSINYQALGNSIFRFKEVEKFPYPATTFSFVMK